MCVCVCVCVCDIIAKMAATRSQVLVDSPVCLKFASERRSVCTYRYRTVVQAALDVEATAPQRK